MKKLFCFAMGALIVSGLTAAALAADSYVARDFEGTFKADGQKIVGADGKEYANFYNGPASTSEGGIEAVKGAVGNQAVHILWDKQDWAGFGFSLPEGAITSEYKKIRLMVKGTGSELQWRLHLNDAGNEQLTTIIVDESDAWQTIEINLSDYEHRGDWQPEDSDNDEIMEFPLKSVTLESYDSGQYDLYVDQIEFLK